MTLIKSISGIRGTIGGPAGENLTPPDVVKFTTAYVRLIARRNPGKKLTIVVGRDARISGEMVSNLVEGTLLACGADVVNVGLCTTPGTEMAVIGKKADGGKALILRLTEMEGVDKTVEVTLPFDVKRVTRTDLIEEGGEPVAGSGRRLTLRLGHHAIETYKLEL